jgi:hypothetical protein
VWEVWEVWGVWEDRRVVLTDFADLGVEATNCLEPHRQDSFLVLAPLFSITTFCQMSTMVKDQY